MSWIWLWCCVLMFCSCQAYLHIGIPPHLQECYRRGGISLFNPKRLDVFLGIMSKLERSTKPKLNFRQFSSSLLRNLRHDGIERYTTVENDYILPYRASGFQFQKYKLFMDYLLPHQPLLFAEEILSTEEKCLMHRMLSSTVRRWVNRGSEKTACVMPVRHASSKIPYVHIGKGGASALKIHSNCPVEEGVVQTEWGNIAPGVLIAGLSSAVEYQRVQVSDIMNTDMFGEGVPESFMASARKEWMVSLDDISNVMVATLAGDLAELVIYQGPKVGNISDDMDIGTLEGWDDSIIPRDLFLYAKNASQPNEANWHFTDAELLAGIDSLILADQLKLWTDKFKTLRLSQLIDMYYSHDGLNFDTLVKACNRKALFSKVFDRQQLLTETVAFAHMLSLHQLNYYVPLKTIQAWSEAAVSALSVYLSDIINRNHHICEESTIDSVLDLIVATDSAWGEYQALQFMSWLAQALRLGKSRTTISLVHGNTGAFIIPPVNNILALYDHYRKYLHSWPTRLHVPEVLTSVIQHSLNKTLKDIAYNVSAGPRTLILLVSPVDHPSGADIRQGKRLMTSLRTSYFDVFFAYLSQDLSDFDLKHVPNDEYFLSSLSAEIPDVISVVDTTLIRGIIPQKIVGTHCPVRRYYDFTQEAYADYLPPFHGRHYRIHPFYLREQPVIHVYFRNHYNGRIKVCMWRNENDYRNCQFLIEGEKFDFKFSNPCRLKSTIYDLDCPPINFLVAANTLTHSCEEDNCSLPNQVRFYIKHSGLKCLRLQASDAPELIKIPDILCVLIFIQEIIIILYK